MKEIASSIYRTLVYQSVFSHSPSIEHLKRWLISSRTFTNKELMSAITRLRGVTVEDESIYLKKNSYKKMSLKRKTFSIEKIELAKKYAGILSKIPWYRMIAISGAVASYNATEKDDIDFFIIVAPKRIWLARLFDWLLLNLLKVRRNARSQQLNNKICINYYLSEESLELDNKDLYTANEIARLIPLYGRDVYKKFVLSNAWIKVYLANFWQIFLDEYGDDVDRQLPFRFVLVDLIELLCGKLQKWYMRKKMTKEFVSEEEIRFHPKDVRKETLQRYEEGLQSFGVK